MKLADLSNMCNGVIDVFIICDAGRGFDCIVDSDLGERGNKVYFTPSVSHRVPGRQQKLEGTFSPERCALIFDDGWWKGDSFRETLGFLTAQGYSTNSIYGYFVNGEVSPDLKGPPEQFDTAENILKILPKCPQETS